MMCLWRAVGCRKRNCAYSNHSPGDFWKVTTAVLQGKQHLCAQHCTHHCTTEEKGSSFSHPLDFTLCGMNSDELLPVRCLSSGTICSISVCWCPVALNFLNSMACICMNFWFLTFLLFLTLNTSLGKQRSEISIFWALLQQELFYGNKTPAEDKDKNVFVGEHTTVANHQELWALWICPVVDLLLPVCCSLCWERRGLNGWGPPSSWGSLGSWGVNTLLPVLAELHTCKWGVNEHVKGLSVFDRYGVRSC